MTTVIVITQGLMVGSSVVILVFGTLAIANLIRAERNLRQLEKRRGQ